MQSFRNASIAVRRVLRLLRSSISRVRFTVMRERGMAAEARIPTIAMTTISSMSVRPLDVHHAFLP